MRRLAIASLLLSALLASNSLVGAEAERVVLILPGITGSLSKTLFCNDKRAIASIERLLRNSGVIELQIPDSWVLDPILGTYDSLQLALAQAAFRPVPVPYDWRLSAAEIARRFLKPHVELAIAEGRQVDVVAHSFGGLVARYYLQTFGAAGVRKVAFLGTPHRGTVDAYYLWEGGIPEAPEANVRRYLKRLLTKMKEGCGCDDISPTRFIRSGCPKAGVGAIVSVQELLPTFPFLRRGTDLIGASPSDMCQQNSLARLLNDNADRLVASGAVLQIFGGDGEDTASAIRAERRPRKKCSREKWPDSEPAQLIKERNGDNRVIWDQSACPRASVPAFRAIPCISARVKHGDLPNVFKEEIVEFLMESGPATITTTTIPLVTATTTPTTSPPTTTPTTLPGQCQPYLTACAATGTSQFNGRGGKACIEGLGEFPLFFTSSVDGTSLTIAGTLLGLDFASDQVSVGPGGMILMVDEEGTGFDFHFCRNTLAIRSIRSMVEVTKVCDVGHEITGSFNADFQGADGGPCPVQGQFLMFRTN